MSLKHDLKRADCRLNIALSRLSRCLLDFGSVCVRTCHSLQKSDDKEHFFSAFAKVIIL